MTTLLLIAGLLASSTVCLSQGGSFSADSAAIAPYWTLSESGETDAALSYLMNLGEADSRLEQMANFVLAYQAFAGTDYEQVLAYLDLGIPDELRDHGLWLRAWSLTEAGFPENSVAYWEELLRDSSSVFLADALLELAAYMNEAGASAEALERIRRHDAADFSSSQRLRASSLEASVLTKLGRHAEAVDGLWNLAIDYPRSPEGREARDALRQYAKVHQYEPRKQTVREYVRELRALESAGQFDAGLNRIREASREFSGRETVEPNLYYAGRFQCGLKRYSDGIETLKAYLQIPAHTAFRTQALYHIGRSSYFIDRDSTAINAFEELRKCSDDLETVRSGLELYGLLLQDRDRPTDAAEVYEAWLKLSDRESERNDARWRLGWASWDAGDWPKALANWSALRESGTEGEYAPAALYWSARAAEKSGRGAEAAKLRGEMRQTFPYSYYSVHLPSEIWTGQPDDRPLRPRSLDELARAGGVHSGKFALLAAMRLADAAANELPGAKSEYDDRSSWSWWQVQLELWRGNRLNAWRTLRTEFGEFIRSTGDRPRAFYDVVYPLDYEPTINDEALRQGLDPYFIFALICQESHYEEEIVSSAGAIGLMQLMPATARLEAAKAGVQYSYDRLSEADYNLKLGISHVAGLMEEFQGDSVLVLAAYNAGKEVVQKWIAKYGDLERDVFIEKIPYRETRLFVKRNLEHGAAYRRLYPDAVPVRAAVDEIREQRP